MTIQRLATALAGIVGLSVAAGGCLLKDVTPTWYLEPDGSVTWQIVEKDVRSDSELAVDRQNEEAEYRAAVGTETHPVALALIRLGGTSLKTRVLRGSRPYTTITEARFASLGQLGQQIFATTQMAGTSVLEPTAGGYTWTLTVLDGDGAKDEGGALAALDGLENLHIVLTDGRFTAAQGFDLSSDKRVATIIAPDDDHAGSDQNQTWRISLSWTGQ